VIYNAADSELQLTCKRLKGARYDSIIPIKINISNLFNTTVLLVDQPDQMSSAIFQKLIWHKKK